MCITSVIGMLIGLSLISSVHVLFAARYWLTVLRGPLNMDGNIVAVTYAMAAIEVAISLFFQ